MFINNLVEILKLILQYFIYNFNRSDEASFVNFNLILLNTDGNTKLLSNALILILLYSL